MERITVLRDFDYPNGSWINRDGRPKKKNIVVEWRAENPNRRKADCIRETGLDRKTVSKYWDD